MLYTLIGLASTALVLSIAVPQVRVRVQSITIFSFLSFGGSQCLVLCIHAGHAVVPAGGKAGLRCVCWHADLRPLCALRLCCALLHTQRCHAAFGGLRCLLLRTRPACSADCRRSCMPGLLQCANSAPLLFIRCQVGNWWHAMRSELCLKPSPPSC